MRLIFTSYLGSVFPEVLKQPKVEYRQANLTVACKHENSPISQPGLRPDTIAATVASCFEPPEGQAPFDYVFDFTGEIQWDRSEAVRTTSFSQNGPDALSSFPSLQVQITHTFKIARLIGLEAARRKVAAYTRIQHPFYNCKENGTHDEKEDVKPEGVMGTWWHESLRALGAIPE